MTDCPFCKKIMKGMDEHGVVHDTKLYNVKRFEPLNPVTPGHMLFVPVAHFVMAGKGNLATADAFDAAIRYARSEGIEDYNLIQSNGASATQTVPHVHVHLVPRVDGDDLALPWDNNAEERWKAREEQIAQARRFMETNSVDGWVPVEDIAFILSGEMVE